jgi:hypothetical protein
VLNRRGGPVIDTTVPHTARVYDYWLGGKDNFAADRKRGDRIAKAFPHIRTAARENRGFQGRTVRYLAMLGYKQFLDIGTGLPTAEPTHAVAQQIYPAARVAYVDNDPLVLVHARALLNSGLAGATSYTQADLREPEKILADDDLNATLDLTKPMVLMLGAILHFITDDEGPYAIVRTLMDRLAPDSVLVASHGSWDLLPPATKARLAATDVGTFTPRSHDQILEFYDGLEFLESGLTVVSRWGRSEPGPGDPPIPEDREVSTYGGVARKPG